MTREMQLKYLDELYAAIERGEASVIEINTTHTFDGHIETQLKVTELNNNRIKMNSNTVTFNDDSYIYRADPSQYTSYTGTSLFNTITGIS